MTTRRPAVFAISLLLCAVAACGPGDYEKAAKGIQGVAISVQGLQNVIIEGHLRGQITTEDARAVMRACERISEANTQASGLVRQLSKLQEQDRVNLFSVIHPVLETVDNIMALELTGIKDPALKAKIRLAIGTMQLTLRGIEAALVGGEHADQT